MATTRTQIINHIHSLPLPLSFAASFALVMVVSSPFACDDAGTDQDQGSHDADRVDFRANPEVLYLTQYEASISLESFSKMVLECDNLEKVQLAVTWTGYAPTNPTGGGPRVLGFGFSTMAHTPLIDCYKDLMLEMGAHP